MRNIKQIVIVLALIIVSGYVTLAKSGAEKSKNVLLINSYHQGFVWTDSLTTGIKQELKQHSDVIFYIEHLNSKQFGQSHFEITKRYFQEKYANIPIDGVLVTDNDALDFAFKYEKELFPGKPVVFAGVSNPEDYPLKETNFWGFKETSNTDSIVDLIKRLLPESKKLLFITDKTTTGRIYREDLMNHQQRFPDLSIEFPPIMNVDSICKLVDTSATFDAIFYIGVNQDNNGNAVDNVALLERLGELANVPLFSNDILYLNKGVIGGLFQSGIKQGAGAADLLFRLMTAANDSFSDVSIQEMEYFFDYKLLHKYNISIDNLPHSATIHNKPTILNKKNFGLLISVLIVLSAIIVFLIINDQKHRAEQKRSISQLREIESQKNQLETTSKQLEQVISELENTNIKLNNTNANLLKAKKKAEESDRLKSAFLANVSHEIRTPLNSIVGFSSLLAESELAEETRNFYSELIESNSETLLVLIDEIIDLSKIEAQQLTINKQEFSIDLLMTELFQTFKNSHKKSLVELRMSKVSEETELVVFSDKVRVKQIFINLLSNAYKFTEESFIEFGYHLTESNQIQLFVRDSGIGIDEEYHEAVFERFRKLNDDQKKVYSGTGLGLAITKKLVELLGGQIWIQSEVGIGTVFFFTLSDLELRDISTQ